MAFCRAAVVTPSLKEAAEGTSAKAEAAAFAVSSTVVNAWPANAVPDSTTVYQVQILV